MHAGLVTVVRRAEPVRVGIRAVRVAARKLLVAVVSDAEPVRVGVRCSRKCSWGSKHRNRKRLRARPGPCPADPRSPCRGSCRRRNRRSPRRDRSDRSWDGPTIVANVSDIVQIVVNLGRVRVVGAIVADVPKVVRVHVRLVVIGHVRQLSQTSPGSSESTFDWSSLWTSGQLSQTSPAPSPVRYQAIESSGSHDGENSEDTTSVVPSPFTSAAWAYREGSAESWWRWNPVRPSGSRTSGHRSARALRSPRWSRGRRRWSPSASMSPRRVCIPGPPGLPQPCREIRGAEAPSPSVFSYQNISVDVVVAPEFRAVKHVGEHVRVPVAVHVGSDVRTGAQKLEIVVDVPGVPKVARAQVLLPGNVRARDDEVDRVVVRRCARRRSSSSSRHRPETSGSCPCRR